jgi:hypothetical protein
VIAWSECLAWPLISSMILYATKVILARSNDTGELVSVWRQSCMLLVYWCLCEDHHISLKFTVNCEVCMEKRFVLPKSNCPKLTWIADCDQLVSFRQWDSYSEQKVALLWLERLAQCSSKGRNIPENIDGCLEMDGLQALMSWRAQCGLEDHSCWRLGTWLIESWEDLP